jgi:ABC-type nickel/cobalt efflux system permease component RcnA
MVGIVFGISLTRLEGVESMRGTWAAWGLILFGLLYAVWGLRRATRGRTHSHVHGHEDGTVHLHPHSHGVEHLHAHKAEQGGRMTPWVLFVIFLLGPCEALIPLLMFPAATESWTVLLLVTATFGGATLVTMLALVLLGLEGSRRFVLPGAERYGHVVAGLTLLLCGAAIHFLGI